MGSGTEEVGKEDRRQIIFGPDGHGKKFNFHLKGYMKLLESYKESQFTFIFLKIILPATWSLDGRGSQVKSGRPFRSMEDFSREDMPAASFSVAVMKTAVKIKQIQDRYLYDLVMN